MQGSKVLHYTRKGWPEVIPECLKPYWNRHLELSIEGNIILCGMRVVIPLVFRQRVMEELHQGHSGVVRMKSLARSHFWWPGVDKDVENLAKTCMACQSVKNAPTKAPLHPWAWPMAPWQRVHVDFAGPFAGKMFLIVVDAHSKWPEVHIMSSTTAAKTIAVLREIFARYGLSQQLVSDNGPQFTAEEFTMFLRANGVKHIKCTPYHPASNGAAERMVQTMKQSLRAGISQGISIEQSLMKFLLQYRITPHAITGVSPSYLFLGREIRTRLDLLHPDVTSRVQARQLSQKDAVDRHRLAIAHGFPIGQQVMARNFHSGAKWVPGTVIAQRGPVSYRVEVQGGRVWRRHVDHLREFQPMATEIPQDNVQQKPDSDSEWSSLPYSNDAEFPVDSSSNELPQEGNTASSSTQNSESIDTPQESAHLPESSDEVADNGPSEVTPRYPVRQRRPPARLREYMNSEGIF